MEDDSTPPGIERQAAKTAGARASAAFHRYELPVVRELPLRLARVDDHDGW